jgi:RimJ/RimL family protein N-acetyltransferase
MFFDQRFIEAEEQLFWYHSIYLNDPGDLMWVAHLDEQPVCTGALCHVNLVDKSAEWSRLMVGEQTARGKGVAGRIARLVRDYGLDDLGLERLYGSLWSHNEITLHIDMAAGYMPYKTENGVTFVELFSRDWRP